MSAPIRSSIRRLTASAALPAAAAVLLLGSGCQNTSDPYADPVDGTVSEAASSFGDRLTDPERERQREETYLRMNDDRGYPRDSY
ncbi:MAG TPA: hypothetical protein VMN36_10815 [Verrucomicrobiales bacterium]|nr:hypothetical protein [Verrucomicrobiales bacterium]